MQNTFNKRNSISYIEIETMFLSVVRGTDTYILEKKVPLFFIRRS
jgi:hypothetical protein